MCDHLGLPAGVKVGLPYVLQRGLPGQRVLLDRVVPREEQELRVHLASLIREEVYRSIDRVVEDAAVLEATQLSVAPPTRTLF